MTQGLVAPAQSEVERWMPPVPSGHPRHPLRSGDTAAVWNGLVWGRLGRGDRAWAWWASVEDAGLEAWVAAERGRLLREFGLHAAARELEENGLAAATDLVDAVMLRLSLVADAVGAADEAGARRGLGAASSLLDELPVDDRVRRQRLRRCWVQVEVDLLAGSRPSAKGLPGRGRSGLVFPVDHEAGTDFHRAKGLLFGGIVREDDGLLREAAGLAPPALRWAVELARLDAGHEDAAQQAVTAWDALVPPPDHERAIAAAAPARRIRRLASR